MPAEVEIAPIDAAEFERLLTLIAAYQRFYEVEDVDEERNRAFFHRFLAPSKDGMLIGAREGGEIVGYACLYWHFSSLAHLEWATAPGNVTAQRLYDSTGAERSEWVEYELPL